MSADNPRNPYLASQIAPIPPVYPDSGLRMEYSRAVKFIWDNPNWLTNLLFVGLVNLSAGFIPILPVLVLYGYQCELLEALLVRSPEPYPDFKFERLMDYLVRGIWPFLVMLLAGICLVPIMLLVVVAPILVMGLAVDAAGRDGSIIAVIFPVIFLLAITVVVLCNILILPLVLRAALMQEVGAALDFEFAVDFARRMWKETILAGFFLVLVALLVQIVGLLLLCVGVILTVPLIHFVKVHLGLQLYQVYLSRGGRKIPLKGAEVEIGY